ncbi:MAG: S41 family peptidase, partial [Bacteroidota bacterium]
TLEKEAIENLVIDLRYNSGGSDGHAVYLARHFFAQPFDYWDKIEVTEDVFNQIKGKYKIFYKKPRQQDSTYLWRGARWWLSKEFNYYKQQKPAKPTFKGKVYLISNGLCMSSCADLVAILAHHHKAQVVGQESGGGYQGNTSGLMPTNPIFAHLEMTIPLQKYSNAVDPKHNFGRGTLPQYPIYPSLEDWLNQRDVELNFVDNLIKNSLK